MQILPCLCELGPLHNLVYRYMAPITPYTGYQRFFSRAAGIFSVGQRPTHLQDLTETGNRARKVSGTQGKNALTRIEKGEHCSKVATMVPCPRRVRI